MKYATISMVCGPREEFARCIAACPKYTPTGEGISKEPKDEPKKDPKELKTRSGKKGQ